MSDISVQVLRTGTDAPEPERHLLRAGPITAVLENGSLRSICYGTQEVLSAIYAAVRDRNWGTILPRFTTYEIQSNTDSFSAHLVAEHVNADVDFLWEGFMSGDSDGTLSFTFDGKARRSFYRNRIGFCLLHPMQLAGSPVEIETSTGTLNTHFPEQIAPHQPFVDILTMRYPVPSQPQVTIELRFEGDIFETEDQRNWTDASYKTYCTPLTLPYPVEVQAGERVRQVVTLQALREDAAASVSSAPAQPLHVHVSLQSVSKLPSLGLQVGADQSSLSEYDLQRLRTVQPAFLWVELDLNSQHWQQLLQQAVAAARALEVTLELSVVTGDQGEGLEALAHIVAEQQLPVARIIPFPRTTFVTTEQILRRTRQAFHDAGLQPLIGGGSRANFTELNRATLPLDHMELAGSHLNPQVHAFDNRSMIETLAAQEVCIRNIHALTHELPLSIGPVTLKPRFNPVAAGPMSAPVPGELPENVDVRQMSLFAAGWTIGSLRHIATAGARWLTYYELLGWRGIMEREQPTHSGTAFPVLPGATFPLYHIFADLAAFSEGELLAVEISDTLSIEALAIRKEQRLLLLVANLSATAQDIALTLPTLQAAKLRLLDERVAQEALYHSETYRQQTDQPLDTSAQEISLHLLPYAIACLEGSIATG